MLKDDWKGGGTDFEDRTMFADLRLVGDRSCACGMWEARSAPALHGDVGAYRDVCPMG